MVEEAQEHAAEDKKRRESIEARNHADSLVYSTEKSLKEHGQQLTAADRSAIEAALADLKGVLDSDDAEQIRSKTEVLAQASMKLGEAMYKSQSADGGAPGDEGGPAKDENVVDADFEEVDGDKKRSA
jgi:molecular chaperone DnaK